MSELSSSRLIHALSIIYYVKGELLNVAGNLTQKAAEQLPLRARQPRPTDHQMLHFFDRLCRGWQLVCGRAFIQSCD